MTRFKERSFALGLFYFVVVASLAYLFGRRFTGPLVRLSNASSKVAKGDFTVHIEPESRDEIGELAQFFNDMVKRLRELYEGLEQKVKERTEDLNRRNLELAALIKTNQSISAGLDLNKVLEIAVREAVRTVNVSYSSIILVEEGKEYGTVASEYSLINHLKPSLGEILYFKDFPTLNEAYQKRQYVLVADTLKHELSPKEMKMAERLNIGSILVVPLVLGEKTLGTMQLSSLGEVKDFTEEEIGICQTIANQVAIAIENAHLYEKEQRAMELLKEQQKAFMEVSVPVVKIWNRILLVPLIGVFDSARAQLVMETLLTEIENTQAKVVILDVSGIPVVDSLVAKHLIRTVSAVKLMGAECIVTGIRSRISQTIVQLGIDLSGITTRTALAEGLKVALDLTDQKVVSK